MQSCRRQHLLERWRLWLLNRSVTVCPSHRVRWGGDYFRLAATFGKGMVTSRSSAAMMPSGARDTHRPTCQNIAARYRHQLYFGHCSTTGIDACDWRVSYRFLEFVIIIFRGLILCVVFLFLIIFRRSFTHHHQPINVPASGAQTFPADRNTQGTRAVTTWTQCGLVGGKDHQSLSVIRNTEKLKIIFLVTYAMTRPTFAKVA
jgi:hypothetical protein